MTVAVVVASEYPMALAAITALPWALPVIVTRQLGWAVETVQVGETVATDAFWLTIPTVMPGIPELPTSVTWIVVVAPVVTLSVVEEKASVPGTGAVETVTIAEAPVAPGAAALSVAVPFVRPLTWTVQELVDPASSERMHGAEMGTATPEADVVTVAVTADASVLPLSARRSATELPVVTA